MSRTETQSHREIASRVKSLWLCVSVRDCCCYVGKSLGEGCSAHCHVDDGRLDCMINAAHLHEHAIRAG
jgi:hypothetical protein